MLLAKQGRHFKDDASGLKYMAKNKLEETTKIALFRGKEVRKTIYKNEWWFSVVDIIKILTDNKRPRKYWNDLKKKLKDEGYVEVSEKIGQLKLLAPDGKLRETDCANTESIFRIIPCLARHQLQK